MTGICDKIDLVKFAFFVCNNVDLVFQAAGIKKDENTSLTIGMYPHPDGPIVLVPDIDKYKSLGRQWLFVRIMKGDEPVYDVAWWKILTQLSDGLELEKAGCLE